MLLDRYNGSLFKEVYLVVRLNYYSWPVWKPSNYIRLRVIEG
jgi:hypothetical protein